MSLARFEQTLVDDAGNVLSTATVTVRRETSGSPMAILYSDRAGTVPMANPVLITPSDDGLLAFHAIGGAYRIEAVSGSYSRERRYVGIGTAQEQDANTFAMAGWTFEYEPGTTSPPGDGCIRFNHATLSSATKAYIDYQTLSETSAAAMLAALDPGAKSVKNRLLVMDQATGTPVSFAVDSVTDHTTWKELTLSDHQGATSFSGATVLTLQPQISGADGVYPAPDYVSVSQFGTGYAALAAAWAVSKKIVCTPGEEYIFTPSQRLEASGEDVDIVAPYSTFTMDTASGSVGFFKVDGGWEEEQSISLISGDEITVEDGSAYALGDIVKVASDEPTPEYALNGLQGEFAVVRGIAGNVLTLQGPLFYTYDTAENARVARLKSNLKCRINIGKIVIPTSPSTGSNAIAALAFKDPQIYVDYVPYVDGTIIRTYTCFGGHREIGTIGYGEPLSSYGISLSGDEYGTARVRHFGPIRHAIDSGGANPTGAIVGIGQHGLAAHNEAYGSRGMSCEDAVFASHHGTRYFTFRDCVAIGGNGAACLSAASTTAP